MRTSKLAVALGTLIVGVGASWAYAQKTAAPAALTALDYAQIQQLYAAYTFAYDLGESDGKLADNRSSQQRPSGKILDRGSASAGLVPDNGDNQLH